MPRKFGKTRASAVDKRVEYLGPSSLLKEDELPTLRSCLRYMMFIKDQGTVPGKDKSVRTIAKEVAEKIQALYIKVNAKLVTPVTIDEEKVIQKLSRKWDELNTILRRQKGWKSIEKRFPEELDKVFDIIHCQCEIQCCHVVTCDNPTCSHTKLRCCDVEGDCSKDNCYHKKATRCVELVS